MAKTVKDLGLSEVLRERYDLWIDWYMKDNVRTYSDIVLKFGGNTNTISKRIRERGEKHHGSYAQRYAMGKERKRVSYDD